MQAASRREPTVAAGRAGHRRSPTSSASTTNRSTAPLPHHRRRGGCRGRAAERLPPPVAARGQLDLSATASPYLHRAAVNTALDLLRSGGGRRRWSWGRSPSAWRTAGGGAGGVPARPRAAPGAAPRLCEAQPGQRRGLRPPLHRRATPTTRSPPFSTSHRPRSPSACTVRACGCRRSWAGTEEISHEQAPRARRREELSAPLAAAVAAVREEPVDPAAPPPGRRPRVARTLVARRDRPPQAPPRQRPGINASASAARDQLSQPPAISTQPIAGCAGYRLLAPRLPRRRP